MSKRRLAFIALFMLVQVSFAAWDGSVKIPKTVKTGGVEYYEITSPEELIGFLDSVTTANMGKPSLRAYLKNDIVFGADTSKLCSKRWERGNRSEYFEGDFDGKGHTIYGLNAERSLFQIVGQGGGFVHDFNVANSSFGSDTAYMAAAVVTEMQSGLSNVNVINTDVRSGFIAGGVVARMLSPSDAQLAYILSCNMIGGSVKGSTYVGGVVGTAYGRVAGCTNSAKITFVKNEKVGPDYNVFVGGIAGDADARDGISIENCVNRGDIEMVSGSALSYAGGVVGYVLGSVRNLQNYGNVSAKTAFTCDTVSSDWQITLYVGGIAGSKHFHKNETSEIRDFVNEGDVTAIVESALDEGTLMVGGIFGENRNNAFRNALNKGAIKAYGTGAYRKVYAGGIIGNASIYTDVRGFEKLGNRGTVSAEGPYRVWSGGVAGYMERRGSSELPALSLSYNYGDITGSVTDDPTEYGVLNVGGILGNAYYTIFSDVYNRGKVIAKGKLNMGNSEVGGLVGFWTYPDSSVKNSYSAAPVVKGDTIGGLFGFTGSYVAPTNAYYDGSLVDIATMGRYYYDGAVCTDCKKTTAELQSDEMLDLLNTAGGTVANRGLWVRRGGYPVFKFDSLYKNDSTYLDIQRYAMPPSHADGDTLVYTISKPEELAAFLEMKRYFENFHYKKVKVELANDIVMGRDSTLLSARQMSADTGYASCVSADFNGNNHTIYGLNMSRAMFFCIDSGTVAENFTIANSRFENDWGYSAAGVTVKNSGCVRNVTIRNSFVRGGYSAGGLVADNHNVKAGLILDSKNENTTVISANIAGGIVGQSDGVLQGVRNSGRVYGRLAGGIVGNASPYYMYGGSSMLVGSAYNTGTVVASGDGAVVGGGIAGYSRSSTLSNVFNTGLVEGSSISGSLSVGGVVGVADSNSTITTIGNWGRVHALNGKQVYAGGLVGRIDGYIYRITNSENFVYITPVAYSFNYGPVTVKSALEESYAGGLIGKGKGFTMQTAYNRGSVKNEANVADAVTGGVIATVDSAIIAQTYAFAETLTGKKVAAVTYEATGFDTFNHVLYNADMGNYPAYNGASADMRDSIVEPLSFEEMMYPSVMQLHPGFKSEKYVDNGCLPVFSYDTTSACAVTVVKDFFGDADETYKVGYIVDVFYADSTLNPNDSGLTPVLPKPVVSLLQVEVSGRNVTVMGLLENRPVMVFDMRGRMVASARFHGTSVNLMIPKSGRYLVRSGKQSRLIVVR